MKKRSTLIVDELRKDMLSKEEVLHLLNEAKKEVDRLETNRQEDLGNSINYIENELQLQRVLSQVEAYEKVLG